MTRKLPRRRGFTITEMLAVLMLFAAFAIVAGRLLTATFQLTYSAADAQTLTANVESGLTALRSDVWSAKWIDAKDPHTIELTPSDGRPIAWTIQADKLLRRRGDTEEHWVAPPGASFSSDGAILVIKVGDAKDETAVDEIRMASELNVIAGLTK